ncbi:MAG: hypothetical protein ACK4EX_06710 [Thermaurantimonas sp.]
MTTTEQTKVFLYVLKFEGFLNRWRAFTLMGKNKWKKELEQTFGFFKMMGTGSGNGFGIIPDFGTYIIITTAKNHLILVESIYIKALLKRVKSLKIYEMMPLKSHGLWNGRNPFEHISVAHVSEYDYPQLSVITRGSIKRSLWRKFWKFVPEVARQIPSEALYSVGMGELPLVEQATFSVWKSEEDMLQWAYQNKTHRNVIALTHSLKWYDEELFARFRCREIQCVESIH